MDTIAHQTAQDLFDRNLTAGAAKSAAGSASLQISNEKSTGPALSKQQKVFNRLVKKIKAVRQETALVQELDQELRNLGAERILPAETKWLRASRKLVMVLHQSPHQKKLAGRQKRKFSELMDFEITELLGTSLCGDDAELKALFEIYTPTGNTFDEAEEEANRLKLESAADMFNFWGMDVSPEDLKDPAKMHETIRARIDELNDEDAKREEQRASRKQSKSQQNAAAKQAAAEEAVKKTTRQIYLDLVKHYHPDREQDEAKRAEKTEWMKQITAAYDANDHLRLLELQMTLLADRDNACADFSESELKYFNQSLERQLVQLQEELMTAHPMRNGNMFGRFFRMKRSVMVGAVEEQRVLLNQSTLAAESNIRLIGTEQGLKSFVSDYEFPLPENPFVDNPFGAFTPPFQGGGFNR